MTTFTEKVEELTAEYQIGFVVGDKDIKQHFDSFKQALNEAHQAEISRVLERVEKEANVYNVKSVNGELVQFIEDTGVMAVPLEAINKIKGEYSE